MNKGREFEDFSINKAYEEIKKWILQVDENTRVIKGEFNEDTYYQAISKMEGFQYEGDIKKYGVLNAYAAVGEEEYLKGSVGEIPKDNKELSNYLFSLVLRKAFLQLKTSVEDYEDCNLLDILEGTLRSSTLDDSSALLKFVEQIEKEQEEKREYDKNTYQLTFTGGY